MRRVLLILIGMTQLAFAQSSLQAASSGTTLLSSAYYSMFGAQQIQSLRVTGTVSRSGEINSISFEVLGSNSSRLDLGSGRLIEVRDTTASIPIGQWQIDGSEAHQMATHNLWIPAGWLLPQPIVSNGLIQGTLCAYLGQVQKKNELLDHLRYSKNSPQKTAAYQTLVSKLSMVDLYLDPGTHLPRLATFTQHPDQDTNADFAVEVWFSDYRLVNGTLSPFRIEQFLDGSLQFDITVSDAAINAPLNTSDFTLQ